jgi:drug/metabolite transporter (DMT)-like permease
MRVLRELTALGLHEPELSPLQIAFFRGLFAGLVLIPLVSRSEVRFRPLMAAMVACFAVMSGLYMTALGLGPAANAILLQNSAPVWVFVIGVGLLGEKADRRNWQTVLLAMTGAGLIVAGNWPRGLAPDEQARQVEILLMATGSGIAYAGVILFLSALRAESSAWLSVLNLLGSAGCVAAFTLATHDAAGAVAWFAAPTAAQLAFLAVFGAMQMGAPYFLFARGLRTVGPQEAGIITLLEPLLNPLWAYLIAPDKETPTVWTWVGGGVLMAALAWRYAPRRGGAGEGATGASSAGCPTPSSPAPPG